MEGEIPINHKEIENLNRSETSKETKSVIKILPSKKSPRPNCFIDEGNTKYL